LAGSRLKERKKEEEKISMQRLEAEERLLQLPEVGHYTLSPKEYERLRKDRSTFIEEAPLRQKRPFLSKFIHAITIHPDKIVMEYQPPTITETKSPSRGQSFLEPGLAAPRGTENEPLGAWETVKVV